MKAERRQELKTNELSMYLMEVREYARQHASTIAIVVVGVVLLGSALAYRNHTVAQTREQGWQAYHEATIASLTPVPENPAWQDEALAKLEGVIAAGSDPVVVVEARLQLAQFCLQQFLETGDPQKRAQFLDRAEEQYKAILAARPSRTQRGAVLNGLVAVAENRFVVDGRGEHRENARKYLEQLRDGKEFTGTVFQTDALARLNTFEELWKPLVLVEPPPAPVPAEGTGSEPKDSAQPQGDQPAAPVEAAPEEQPATEDKPAQEEEKQAEPEKAPVEAGQP